MDFKSTFEDQLTKQSLLSKKQSDVLSTIQSLSKEVENFDNLIANLKYGLKNFGYKASFEVFTENEAKCDSTKLLREDLEKIIMSSSVVSSVKDLILPLRGDNRLQIKTNFPGNDQCYFGFMIIEDKKGVKKKDKNFIKAYSDVAGSQIHHFISGKMIDQQKEVIEAQHQTLRDLTSLLAHDIRGPLTSIIGFSDLLRNSSSIDSAKIDNATSKIKLSAMQINDLLKLVSYFGSDINENVVVSGIEGVDLWNFAHNGIIRDIKNINAPYKIYLSMDNSLSQEVLLDNDQYFGVNKTFFGMILNNLIGNALKYTTKEGPNKNIVLSMYRQSGDVVIDILNSIQKKYSESEIESAKIKGVRLDSSSKGIVSGSNKGLGVYMIKRFVEEGYGGKMEIGSDNSIDIRKVFDSSKKRYVMIHPQSLIGGLEASLPSNLNAYFRNEVRIPERNLIFSH